MSAYTRQIHTILHQRLGPAAIQYIARPIQLIFPTSRRRAEPTVAMTPFGSRWRMRAASRFDMVVLSAKRSAESQIRTDPENVWRAARGMMIGKIPEYHCVEESGQSIYDA